MVTMATLTMMAAAGASTAMAASPQTLREVYQSYRDNVVAITYTLWGRVPMSGWHYPEPIAALWPRGLSDNVVMIGRR